MLLGYAGAKLSVCFADVFPGTTQTGDTIHRTTLMVIGDLILRMYYQVSNGGMGLDWSLDFEFLQGALDSLSDPSNIR